MIFIFSYTTSVMNLDSRRNWSVLTKSEKNTSLTRTSIRADENRSQRLNAAINETKLFNIQCSCFCRHREIISEKASKVTSQSLHNTGVIHTFFKTTSSNEWKLIHLVAKVETSSSTPFSTPSDSFQLFVSLLLEWVVLIEIAMWRSGKRFFTRSKNN